MARYGKLMEKVVGNEDDLANMENHQRGSPHEGTSGGEEEEGKEAS